MSRIRKVTAKPLLGAVFLLVFASVGQAQTTHNLEIVFEKSYNPQPDSIWDFGRSIASAGDVNADGFDDIIVGASTVVDTPWVWMGLAFIFFGGEPMDTVPDLILEGGLPFGMYGFCVSSAGDLNGDGYDDVMVGAPNADVYYGKVYIYFGGPGLDTIPDLVLWGRPTGGDIGDALSYAGDVNGDGWDDIVTGGAQGFSLSGQVAIFFGGPSLDTIPDVILYGHNSEGFGMSVGGGGDVNSDGYDDVVAGAWDNDEAYPNAGKIYVYLGGDPMDTIPDVWMHGEGGNQHLGWNSVDLVEDTLSYDWTLTGTPLWPNGFMARNNGKVYVLFGGDPMDSLPDVQMVGQTDSSALGMWSSTGGAANQDRHDGIVCGAPANAEHVGGAAYLWLASLSMDTIPDAWLAGRWPRDLVGYRVACAGDVVRDGYDEIMVSNYPADSLRTVWVCRYTGMGVEEKLEIKSEKLKVALRQNWPNPFTDMTNISYRLVPSGAEGTPDSAHVSLRVYDITGRLIKTLVDEQQEPGDHSVRWEGKDGCGRILPCGVYFCKLRTSRFTAVSKMVLIR